MKKSTAMITVSLIVNLSLLGLLVFNLLKDSRPSEKNLQTSVTQTESAKPDYFTGDKLTSQSMELPPRIRKSRKLREKNLTEYENIKMMFSADDNLELIKYKSEEFDISRVKNMLHKLPSLSLYSLVIFQEPITYKTIEYMKQKGIIPVRKKYITEYIHKNHGIFYSHYRNLSYIYRSRMIKGIYILKKYTAKGIYKLNFLPGESAAKADVRFSLPYSKYGHQLISRPVSVGGINRVEVFEEKLYDNTLKYKLELKKNSPLTLYCDLRYIIDIEKTLQHHIYIAGEINMKKYLNKIKSYKELEPFLKPSKKIVMTDTISNLARHITYTNTLAYTWYYLSQKLDDMITYDWNKRYDFFSGNIPYNDIREMYMTSDQLMSIKKGACPEQSSVEAAFYRILGVPVRTSTRLYHMYIDVFIPDTGWCSTSALLNEIPLCHSTNHKQSYFVDWDPDIPVKLKWEGGLYPLILY